MQTFLPYADFERSARALDQRRLGKQRVECIQVVRGLTVEGYGWRHHPAVKMWRGYEEALSLYFWSMVEEWRRRGYRSTIELPRPEGNVLLPPWLGDERLHASHRSNLLRKEPGWYGNFGWSEQPDLPYWWPRADHTRR